MTSPHSFWAWSPEIHFPWSGGVKQHIEPDLTWFSNWITPGAGNAAIEEKAFTSVASYGKQLGLITEVLLALLDQSHLAVAPEAVKELRRIKGRIDELKAIEYTLDNDQIVALVSKVCERDGPELRDLARQLVPMLVEKTQPPGPPDAHSNGTAP